MRWQIIEEETYERCVGQLGGAKHVDRATAVILDALVLNPYGFPLAGYKQLRLARTRIIAIGREIIPALTVIFTVEVPETVRLLHIEVSLPDEMEISDVWPWV